MDKFEKTFKDIKDNVKQGVSIISKKSIELADKTKAKTKIASINNKIEKLYCVMGELICDLKDDKISAEAVDEKLESAYSDICKFKDMIEELEEKIDNTTERCPDCGHRNSKNAKFCSDCGLRFNKEDTVYTEAANDTEETEEIEKTEE